MTSTTTKRCSGPNKKESLGLSLFKMTWPMLFGVLSLMSFQLADSAFIGQLGVDPLAAIGFTIPIYQLIIGVQVGLGIATTAVISRYLGEEKIEQARLLGGVVLFLGAALIALTCAVLWLFKDSIALALGAEERLLPIIGEFWLPWLLSTWMGAMLYFGYSLCRANGNTLLPGLVMVFCSLLNIGLDPLYIFVFEMGLPGAALASLTSFLFGCLIIFPKIFSNKWSCLPQLEFATQQAIKQLSTIMAPAMLSQFMPSLSALLATSLVATYGTSVVGAWGLGIRLEFFSIVIVLALTMSLPPMVGRLLGKGELEKVHQLVKISVVFVLFWQLLLALICLLSSKVIPPLLTTDDLVSATIQNYIQLVPFSYGALGICMIMVSVCNALGLPGKALLISTTRLFVCYLPLLWLGSSFGGLHGLFLGAFAGNLLAGTLAWMTFQQSIKQLMKRKHRAA